MIRYKMMHKHILTHTTNQFFKKHIILYTSKAYEDTSLLNDSKYIMQLHIY